MAAPHQKSEAILRGARMLRTALGPAIARFLEDPTIVEVMLNPDGQLFVLYTRPVFHLLDQTILGHVFCRFLALVPRKELERRLEKNRASV